MMKFLKNGSIILITVAILIWHKQPLPAWQEWSSDLILGFFASYGLKSIWDEVEELVEEIK